jgi:1-acyl-sn-glycerol-3-phosphate acyltransferase
MPWWYVLVRNLGILLIARPLGWEVGGEPVPMKGPLIVVANHLSYLDPLVLAYAIPRFLYYMAKAELWAFPLFGALISLLGAFPVRRGMADLQAMGKAVTVLKHGKVLALFPEGTRSKTHTLHRGKPGAVLLHLKTGVPILPVGIVGTHLQFIHGFIPARLRVVKAKVGRPFRLRAPSLNPERQELDALTDTMMLKIAELIPEEYRGVYAGRKPDPDLYQDLQPGEG